MSEKQFAEGVEHLDCRYWLWLQNRDEEAVAVFGGADQEGLILHAFDQHSEIE